MGVFMFPAGPNFTAQPNFTKNLLKGLIFFAQFSIVPVNLLQIKLKKTLEISKTIHYLFANPTRRYIGD